MSIEQIAQEALRLSPRDRALLAETIWESLTDPDCSPQTSEEELVALAQSRDIEIESGKVTPLTHAELMARVRS